MRSRLQWRSILKSATFDPAQVPELEPVGERDVIVAGCPRSGTSLLAGIMFQPPRFLSCMEPWDGLRMPPADLFRSLRHEIAHTGHLSRGRLDIEALRSDRRVVWHADGDQTYEVKANPDHWLAVKWPTFWRYLDHLPDARFLICVRHPAEVVASFLQTGGRLSQGLDYDVPFNRVMNDHLRQVATDAVERCALMYEYINSRVARHQGRSNVLILRYERWISAPDQQLRDIQAFLEMNEPLELNVDIEPTERAIDHALTKVTQQLCPSASSLGYE